MLGASKELIPSDNDDKPDNKRSWRDEIWPWTHRHPEHTDDSIDTRDTTREIVLILIRSSDEILDSRKWLAHDHASPVFQKVENSLLYTYSDRIRIRANNEDRGLKTIETLL